MRTPKQIQETVIAKLRSISNSCKENQSDVTKHVEFLSTVADESVLEKRWVGNKFNGKYHYFLVVEGVKFEYAPYRSVSEDCSINYHWGFYIIE